MFFINHLHRLRPRSFLITIAFATFTLAGCGGGGGGNSGGDGGGSISSPPIAQSSFLATVENTPANDMLVASDPDGNALTYRIVSNASIGTVALDQTTGAYTYTPNPNIAGTDAFTFKANDGALDSNEATVSIQISNAPVAQDGTLAINQDTTGNGTLIATDADNDSLVYAIVSNGNKGTAVITDTASGAYTYTPNLGENGADTFTFKVNDGSIDSNTATISVSINAPPVATGGCNTTPQAQTLSGTLTATDIETPGSLMFSLNTDGSGGTGPVTTARGSVTITDQTSGAFQYVPSTTGARGSDSFSFQVSDPDGSVTSAVETVVVDIKIMPLGDSITSGLVDSSNLLPIVNERVGYRKPLFDALIAGGFTFDFVGSRNLGGNLLSDPETESYGGWTATELAWGMTGFPTDGVRAWLNANPADIVLLHAGTNSLVAGGDIEIELILDEIDVWENSAAGNPVTVLLALIIDQNPINPVVASFNNNVLIMAAGRTTDTILIVDQFGTLNYPADLSDNLHPNPTGYGKMANEWFSTLQAIVDKCP